MWSTVGDSSSERGVKQLRLGVTWQRAVPAVLWAPNFGVVVANFQLPTRASLPR